MKEKISKTTINTTTTKLYKIICQIFKTKQNKILFTLKNNNKYKTLKYTITIKPDTRKFTQIKLTNLILNEIMHITQTYSWERNKIDIIIQTF